MPQSPAGEIEALQLYPGPVSDSQVGKPRSHSDFSMLDNVRVLKVRRSFQGFLIQHSKNPKYHLKFVNSFIHKYLLNA